MWFLSILSIKKKDEKTWFKQEKLSELAGINDQSATNEMLKRETWKNDQPKWSFHIDMDYGLWNNTNMDSTIENLDFIDRNGKVGRKTGSGNHGFNLPMWGNYCNIFN